MHTYFHKLTVFSLLSLATSTLIHAEQFMVQFSVITAPNQWVEQHQLGNTPKELSDDFFKDQAQMETVDILSAPRVTAIGNKEATITIQEAPLYYMEKVGDGYQPRIMPEGTEPGIKITATMNSVEKKPGHILLDWSTKITTLSGREPVPFGLDVGKPIMQTQKYNSRMECFNDKLYFLSKMLPFEAGSQESALIFCKVQKVQLTKSSKPKEFPIELVSDQVSFDSEKGILKANGNVKIQEENFVIYSDKLEFVRQTTKAKGPAIQADEMSLETPESRVRYAGNVRLRINGGTIHAEELYIQQLEQTVRAEGPLEKKLKKLIIPELVFQEVSFGDAIDFLRSSSEQHSPDGQRVDFVFKPYINPKVTVNLQLKNLPLYHVIKYLTESCGYSFELAEDAGVVVIK